MKSILFIAFVVAVSCVHYPPFMFLKMTAYDYSNNVKELNGKDLAFDFPRRNTKDGITYNCVKKELTEIRDGQKVPTPTKNENCPRDINTWFEPNDVTKNVEINIVANQISSNPPLYKFQQTGTPGFAPMRCKEPHDGWGCTENSGSSTTKCYENSWDNPKCFNGYYAMAFHTWIYYNKNTPLLVKSDDDSWTFINNKLAADIGGTHGDWYGVVNMKLSEKASELGLTKENYYYPFDMYYAERGASIAGLTFIISPPPMCSEFPEIKGCCEEIDSDGDGLIDCLDGCPNNSDRTGPGSCDCNQPMNDCEETKSCYLYTKQSCDKTPWAREHCGLCGGYCVPNEDMAKCPCTSFSEKDACESNSDRCSWCKSPESKISYCTDKNKCLCQDVEKDQCLSEAQSFEGSQCKLCNNEICQSAACPTCAEIDQEIKSAITDEKKTDAKNKCTKYGCSLCKTGDGYEEGCVTSGNEEKTCTPNCDDAKWQEDNCLSKCKKCSSSKCTNPDESCPSCKSYSDDKDKCNDAVDCTYCETINDHCIGKNDVCKTCSSFKTKDECTDVGSGCAWCGGDVNICINKSELDADGKCPTFCESLTETKIENCGGNCEVCNLMGKDVCLKKNDKETCKCENIRDEFCEKFGCHLCGPGKCSNDDCGKCSDVVLSNSNSCSSYYVSNEGTDKVACFDCGDSCQNSSTECISCSLLDNDKCEKASKRCDWCGDRCADKGGCPACSERDANKGSCASYYDETLTECKHCKPTGERQESKCKGVEELCPEDCHSMTDAEKCGGAWNCQWCGASCVDINEACPACNKIQEADECNKSFEKKASEASSVHCKYCPEVKGTDPHCVTVDEECWVNCLAIKSKTQCSAVSMCIWCGNGDCKQRDLDDNGKPVSNDNSECPECTAYENESDCHSSVRSCSWCNGSCNTRAWCIGDAAKKAAGIAAGVVAAIVIAAVVALSISAFASKKVYDAIMEARETDMDTATSNPLFEAKEDGGVNPTFQGQLTSLNKELYCFSFLLV